MAEIGRRLAWALDPVSFAADRLNFRADPWQRQLLRSRSLAVMLELLPAVGQEHDGGDRRITYGDL